MPLQGLAPSCSNTSTFTHFVCVIQMQPCHGHAGNQIAQLLFCLFLVQVRCSADQQAITAMASSDGEVVELSSPVTATDAVEVWLHQLADGMRLALQASLRGIAGLSDPFVQAPAQVLSLYHALSLTEMWVQTDGRSGKVSRMCSKCCAVLPVPLLEL